MLISIQHIFIVIAFSYSVIALIITLMFIVKYINTKNENLYSQDELEEWDEWCKEWHNKHNKINK